MSVGLSKQALQYYSVFYGLVVQKYPPKNFPPHLSLSEMLVTLLQRLFVFADPKKEAVYQCIPSTLASSARGHRSVRVTPAAAAQLILHWSGCIRGMSR